MITRALPALKHRNFRLFILGQIPSLIGVWAQIMAQSWLVYDLTNSAMWLGIVDAAIAIPMFLFSLPGGSLADRLPKRNLLLAIHTLGLITAAIYAALIWLDWINIFLIVVLAGISGLLVALEYPVRQSFYIEMVGREDLVNAIALNSTTFNLARLVGPALGGVLVARFGVAWCMAINSLSYLTIITALLFIRVGGTAVSRTENVPLGESFREILRFIRAQRPIKGLLMLVAATTVFGWSVIVMLPVVAKQVLGGGALELGHLMAAAGFGALAASVFVAFGSHRVSPRRLVFTGSFTFVAAILLLSLVSSTLPAVLCVGLAGFGLVMFYVNANSALQRRVPDTLRGRLMGVYALVFGGLRPIGSLQMGLLTDNLGLRFALIFGAVVLASVSFLISRWLPPTRSQPPPSY